MVLVGSLAGDGTRGGRRHRCRPRPTLHIRRRPSRGAREPLKYETTDPFLADFRSLKPHEKVLVMDAIRKINAAYEQHLASGSADHPKWPANLRKIGRASCRERV